MGNYKKGKLCLHECWDNRELTEAKCLCGMKGMLVSARHWECTKADGVGDTKESKAWECAKTRNGLRLVGGKKGSKERSVAITVQGKSVKD